LNCGDHAGFSARGIFYAELTEDILMFDLLDSNEQILNQEYKINIGQAELSDRAQTNTLTDVTNKLGQARLQAGRLNDKLFLYLIDVAIFHAHEMLEKQSDLGEHEKWS
jgi:hypothetical protein